MLHWILAQEGQLVQILCRYIQLGLMANKYNNRPQADDFVRKFNTRIVIRCISMM